jgi:hypothetical protein
MGNLIPLGSSSVHVPSEVDVDFSRDRSAPIRTLKIEVRQGVPVCTEIRLSARQGGRSLRSSRRTNKRLRRRLMGQQGRPAQHNNPRSLPAHYGFGIPGVNAPGIPGVTCNAGAGGLGAGIGRPGISGASVGRSSGGIPSVARTGSLVNPLGSM